MIHDQIFAAGSVLLILALVPAITGRIRAPRLAAGLTAFVLAVYAINYATMAYPLSAAFVGVQAVLWSLVCYRGPIKLQPHKENHA
jgi:hypothetical protein